MEPAEIEITPRQLNIGYTIISDVLQVAQDTTGTWFIRLDYWNAILWIGQERPSIATGDRVKITITKEPSDAKPVE